VLHPIVLLALLVAIVLIVALPRRYVVIPLLFFTFLAPQGQEILIGGVHVFLLRILILTGCLRMLWKRLSLSTALLPGGFTSLDTAFLLWAIFRALTFVLLYLDPVATVNRFAFLWDALGGYFLLRYLIRDRKDIHRVLKCFAALSIIFAGCMIHERITGRNVFGLLGGAREISEVRDGLIRAQATFAHALLAGTFGGTMFPLLLLLWKFTKSRILAAAGMISCIVMVVTSATSTPILALGAGILGLLFWPFRRNMRTIRWALVLGLVALQLIMHAPVWYVISHIDLTGSSSGYHRAVLIDRFIRNFGDWWLLGTKSNANWGADMWDTCNQYVQEGEDGGLPTLIPFLTMIVIGFRWIGKARKSVEGDHRKEIYYWILGSTLFAHVVGFFGISYFDYTRVVWYALLSMISAATLAQARVSSVPPLNPAFARESAAEDLVNTLREQGLSW